MWGNNFRGKNGGRELYIGDNWFSIWRTVMSHSALAATVHQLRSRLAAQQASNDSDERLLHAFLANRDEAAFAVLVRRYGPMVLRVCRRVLDHEQDAEDAFQATFLVFARQGDRLRKKSSLASWLHGVAYRLALKSKQSASRRRKYEEQTITRPSGDPADELSWREVQSLVDEEIARLPEKYRSAFVLCCLEGISQAEAARRLGLKEGTLSSRLTTSRKLLAQRLRRRGVELTAVLAASTLATQPAQALSPLLIAATIKAGLATATGAGMAEMVSAEIVALAQSAAPTLVLSKAKMALVVMLAACALAGAGAWACRLPATPQTGERHATTPETSASSRLDRDKGAVVMVKGRVLLPDGKPAPNATIIRRQLREETNGFTDTVLTTTGADGRFQVEHRDSTMLIASASGLAPDWTQRDFKGGDLTLTLAERTAVRGRLISLEGKPIAGARVKVLAVKVPIRGNLDAVTDAFRLNPEWIGEAMPKALSHPIPSSAAETKIDSDGHFELEGFGKNRVLELRIEADGMVTDKIHVILADKFDPKTVLPSPSERSAAMSANPRPIVYGQSFTHAVRPCQVITGTVTDQATGKPISGVKIIGTAGSLRMYFGNAEWNEGVECVTDRDGRYRLSGLPKADQRHLHVQSGAAPYLDRLLDVTQDVPTLNPVHMDIKLQKALTIAGRLVDHTTGKGVCGEAFYLLLENDEVKRFLADNSLYGEGNSVRPTGIHARTDAAGHFKLRVPAVPGVILARADTLRDPSARYTSIHVADADRKYLQKRRKEEGVFEYGPRDDKAESFDTHMLTWPLRWENGYALVHPKKTQETVNVVIRFHPGQTIHGRIVGLDGRPLAGVQAVGVQANGENGPTTFRTDAFTVYALDSSRPRIVYFRHAAKNLVGTLTLRGDEQEMPVVKMQPAAAVIGRVLDAVGKPLAGMEISIQFSEAEPDQLIRQELLGGRWGNLTTSDADGRFRLAGLFPGLEFQVFSGHPGHRSVAVSFEPVTLKAGEVRDLGARRDQEQEQRRLRRGYK
jgi:RNA polymerase sigma factor (sigma-70 family)